FQAEDGIRDFHVTGVQTCALPIYGARRAVADLEEAHQARRLAAARQPLVLAAQAREVGAGARAVLEQARFPHPQVHDPVLVDEKIGRASCRERWWDAAQAGELKRR